MKLQISVLVLAFATHFSYAAEFSDAPPPAEIDKTKYSLNPEQNYPLREAYFGNFHVHTGYSFDGYTNGSPTNPDDAYRWAQGEAIPGGGDGTPLKIKRPLDWYTRRRDENHSLPSIRKRGQTPFPTDLINKECHHV